MKKIVLLLIALMILISSISFVAAGSVESNRVISHTNGIDIHDYSDLDMKILDYGLTHPHYMATKDSGDFLTYDMDNDGNDNFLIDQDENFLVCDLDNDGDVDYFVSDYDNDGDLDIVKYP